MKNEKKSLIRSESFQTLLASLACILGGLLVGYLALLIIEPSGAWKAITAVMKSFFNYPGRLMLKYFGQTLARTVPLLMCALSVLFAYKVGMFNIGVAGQYVAGACGCLYAALAWNLPWLPCLLIGMAAAALLGAVCGILKTKCNVNVGHHAQLDHPVPDEPDPGHGEEPHQPLHQVPAGHQPLCTAAPDGSGHLLQQ